MVPVGVLDLVPVYRGETLPAAFAGSVALAQTAEQCGLTRVWYAEHHNMAQIASAATSVVIAHVAAHTETIRLGAGGVMLPNHAPLAIAEQFGTLAHLYPDRIDLGVGRAPGTDMVTLRALRRTPMAADSFPDDVRELQGFLSDTSPVKGVVSVTGQGTHVPVYILGSSLFGAELAASLGLPFAFASHFAPQLLTQAVALYRARFTASAALAQPYALAALNIVAAPEQRDALLLARQAAAKRLQRLYRQAGHKLSDEEADAALDTTAGAQVWEMVKYTAAGTPERVNEAIDAFAVHAGVDEVLVVSSAPERAAALRSVTLVGEARQTVAVN
ncbi:MAG: LLM class flavin-dependent oxidoreductase [Nitriliruptoraceae bacterium]